MELKPCPMTQFILGFTANLKLRITAQRAAQKWTEARAMGDNRIPYMMDANEAIRAISGNQPIVIESRKYGIVADWYSARNKNEFSEWLRRRTLAGEYPMIEYGRTWRAWHIAPTDKERGKTPWG